jgi:formate hydrogenlyase transcriptional activator
MRRRDDPRVHFDGSWVAESLDVPNIRELRNVVERAMIVARGTRLTIPIPATSAACASRSVRLVDVEKAHIRSVLQSTGWRVRGIGGAADRLGLKPTTLESRLVKLGLTRPHSS